MMRIFRSPILWYAFASASPAASNFLTASLLLRSLGPNGFAEWSLVEPVLLVGANFMTLGAQFGALKRVSADPDSASRSLAAVWLTFLATVPLNLLIAGPIYYHAFGLPTAMALLLAQLIEAATSSSATIFRARRMPITFGLLEGGRALAILGVITLSLIPDAPTPRDAEQLALLRAGVSAVFLICLVPFVVRPARPDFATASSFLGYGVPIFAAQMVVQVALNADRYILQWVKADYAQITSYVVHSRLAGVLNLALLAPLSLWYPVEVARREHGDHANFFQAVGVVTAGISIVLIVGLQFGADLVWPILFPGVTLDKPLLLALCTCVMFQAMAVIWNVGGLRQGSTLWNVVPPTAALVVLAILGPLLTHYLGALGAGLGRLAALGAYAAVFRAVSDRIVGKASAFTPFAWFAAAFCLTPLIALDRGPALTGAGVALIALCAGAGIHSNRELVASTLMARGSATQSG